MVFKHKDPGSELTQAEFVAACGDGHIFACQATGDIVYASSATVLSKLARGAAGTILNMGGSCIPAWTATPTIGSTSWCNAGHAHAASNSGGTVCANVLAGTTLKSCVVTSSLTSVGTLGALTVDDVAINGKVVTMTGSACDTIVMTAAANGAFSLVTTDATAAAANIQITADGTVDIDSAGILTLDSGAAINIEPAACSAILLDGTISIDAGVVTGATSITSTHYVTGNNGTVKFLDGDGNKYFTLAAHACTTACIAYTFPPAGGSCGNVLTTNGSGALSWAAAGGVTGTGGTDNAILRAHCTGGTALQGSAVTIADTTGDMTFPAAGQIFLGDGCAANPSIAFIDDPNAGLTLATDTVEEIALVHNGVFSVRANGHNVFIGNETANGNVTRGLTINQQCTDNEIFALKSSDVCHGMTAYTEDDTYGFFKKLYAGQGGLSISGFSTAACKSGLDLYAASCGAANDAKSTSALGIIQMRSEVRNPSNSSTTNAATDANMVVMRNGNGNTRFIFDNEGSGHADVEWTTYSDGRLKSNRAEVPYGLDTLMQLRPQIYCRDSGYLDDGNPVLEGTPYRHIGFIAQEVKALVPEIIDDVCESKSWYSLNDGKLTAVVVKAVQELEARVTALEGK